MKEYAALREGGGKMGALHILLIIVIVLVVLLFLVSVGLCTYAVFPKRFGLEETRKIELEKPYLKGMDFPAKETYTVRSYDDYVLHAEYIETVKKICDYQSWLYLYQIWIL